MLKSIKSKSSGNAVLYLVIGVIAICLGIFVYSVIKKYNTPKNEPVVIQPEEKKMPEPVFEAVVGNVKFRIKETQDLGNVLVCEERVNLRGECSSEYDLNTTDRFVKVTVTAQNVGTDNIEKGKWKVQEMIDSVGRKFYSDKTDRWIPIESKCGDLLKPSFEPTPCIMIYEVSNRSTGLKVRVTSTVIVQSNNATKSKKEQIMEGFLDLGLFDEKYCWDAADCGCGLNKYTEKCFIGNKSYLMSSDSTTSASTTEMIKKCEESCAPTQEKPEIECTDSECN